MEETADNVEANQERHKTLELMYQQVASQHDKIDDFRGKLLAVLPAITGLSLFFGLGREDINPVLLPVFGIFGALASIGLYVHELRGITECYRLIANGSNVEEKLVRAADDCAQCGPFSSKLNSGFNGIVSRETAAILVYPTTIAAWAFVTTAHWGCSAVNSDHACKAAVTLENWHAAAAPVLVFLAAAIASEVFLVWDSYKVTRRSQILSACALIISCARSFFQKIWLALGNLKPAHPKS